MTLLISMVFSTVSVQFIVSSPCKYVYGCGASFPANSIQNSIKQLEQSSVHLIAPPKKEICVFPTAIKARRKRCQCFVCKHQRSHPLKITIK